MVIYDVFTASEVNVGKNEVEIIQVNDDSHDT